MVVVSTIFSYFFFSPPSLGEMIQFDLHIFFKNGWFNHHRAPRPWRLLLQQRLPVERSLYIAMKGGADRYRGMKHSLIVFFGRF